MAGHLSAPDLAGIALGLNVLWPSQFLSAASCWRQRRSSRSCAAPVGSAKSAKSCARVSGSLTFAALVLMLFWRNVGIRVRGAGYRAAHDTEIAHRLSCTQRVGARFRCSATFSSRYLCEGMGETSPAMYMALAALALKLPLNYAFMYGHWGAPTLGGVGCGWAAAILWWAEFFGMLLVRGCRSRASPDCSRNFPGRNGRCCSVSSSSACRSAQPAFAEVFAFSLMGLLIGRFGPETLASHQIVGNLNGMTFMVPLALGMATTIRVGFNVGANDFDRARLSALVALRAAAIVRVDRRRTCCCCGDSSWSSLFSTDPAGHRARRDGRASSLRRISWQTTRRWSRSVRCAATKTRRCRCGSRCSVIGSSQCRSRAGSASAGSREPLGIYGFWAGMTAGLAFVAVAATYRLWRTAGDAHRIARLAAA